MPKGLIHNDDGHLKKNSQENHQKPVKGKIVDFYFSIIPFFILNILWLLLSLPVVTIFPALGGLYYATFLLADEKQASWGDIWYGFKKNFWLSMKWALFVLIGTFVLSANVWFYFGLSQNWRVFPLVFSVLLLGLWVILNQFTYPMLLIQNEKKFFLALRNCYIFTVRKPLLVVRVMVIGTIIVIVSYLVPPVILFISMALLCYIQNQAILKGIKEINQRDN